jgi:hypothetical protein
VGPALGRDELKLPESETSVVSDGAGLLWPENARTEKRSQKSGKADETLALKGETNEKCYSVELGTTIHTFYVSRGWSVR